MPSSEKENELKGLKKQEKILSEQISYFRTELHIHSSPMARFELGKRIEESEQRLNEIRSQIKVLENPPTKPSESQGPSYVYVVPSKNKRSFLVAVFIILFISAYNSTSLAVYTLLFEQADRTAKAMVEKQMPPIVDSDGSQRNLIEQFNQYLNQTGTRELLKQQKYQELYPKIWEEKSSQNRFQTWIWVGTINTIIFSLLTLFSFIINYPIRSKIFNLINFIIFITLVLVSQSFLKMPELEPFMKSLPQAIVSIGFVVGPIHLLFQAKLLKAFSYSQNLQDAFSKSEGVLIVSFVTISGIGLGVCLAFLLHNSTAVIFLNGILLAAFLKVSSHLYDYIREDSLDRHWKSRFWR
jgi:hypothetical protein